MKNNRMRIILGQPVGFSHIGKKDRQEDAVWPTFTDVTASSRCIVLCDGVGGSEHGEIASQTSSRIIGEYLSGVIAKTGNATEQDIQDAVNLAYDELDRIDSVTANGGGVSMATTLTCVCISQDGVSTAHMGDSRIYHIRPNHGILHQSDDHSLVNALVKAGQLTKEQAKTFPRKNVITKALQPHTDNRLKAEYHLLSNLMSGDYLFLCSDGVLERLTNERLTEVISMPCSDKEKLEMLEAESLDQTKDNYTAYLIPIVEVNTNSSKNINNTSQKSKSILSLILSYFRK